MITEWFVSTAFGLLMDLIESIPAPAVPEWFSQVNVAITEISAGSSWLGTWFPVWMLSAVLGIWVAMWITGNLIQLVMKGISYFTLGGGAT